MADDDGEALKKNKGVDLGKLVGDDSAIGRLRKQMDALTSSSCALEVALGPTAAVQKMLESHRSVTRILPDMSAFAGIADAARIVKAHQVPKIAGIDGFVAQIL
ncbi:MAG: hypothetical protein ACK5MQ_06770 [Pikeienuella sp.]